MLKRRERKEIKNNQVIDIETARQMRREKRRLSAERSSRKTTSRQTGRRTRRRLLYCLFFVIVAAITGISAYNVIMLKIEKSAAASQLMSLEKEKMTLEEELKEVGSREYVERQAREQLKMVLPGEILYIIKEGSKANNETAN